MVYRTSLRLSMLLAPLTLVLAHCSGTTLTSPTDAGDSADGGGCVDAAPDSAPTCKGPVVDAPHRPSGTICKATQFNSSDAGSACQSDADCAASGLRHCFHGACTIDQCYQDGDCAPGTACVCGDSYYGGNALHGNLCMPASCRVDSDCGAGGRCSPHIAPLCGAITGLSCRSSHDTCASDADCCATPDTPACNYDPTAARWACAAVTTCNG